MSYISRIAAGFAVLTLLSAAWFSIRLARADDNFRRSAPESVARAIEIMPWNTEYVSLKALQLEYDGQDSSTLLQRVAALTPFASAPRIRLGLAAEVRGDLDSAERWLLDANRIDRQFEPRWTLANYYFRRQNTAGFWQWIRFALEVSYGDRRLAFDLCWRTSSDPGEILMRAIPDRHEVVASYLAYLLDTHRLSAAAPIALKLAAAGDPNDRPLLFAVCDTFIDSSEGGSARALWHAMGFPLPSGIVDGEFESPRVGHGFDWRVVELPGVNHVALDAPPAHRVVLSGGQPESSELLRQFVSLHPGKRYIFRWEARTQNLASPTGLDWRVADQHTPLSSSNDWLAGEFAFTTSSEISLLALAYQRPSGQPRAEGSVELRHVTIAEAK